MFLLSDVHGRMDIPARIRGKIFQSDSGCWETSLKTNFYGYVQVGFNKFKKKPGLHRYIFQALCGPVDPDLVLDHKCRNRKCCNPNHLRVVTKEVNTLENSNSLGAVYKARTHCKKGHPLSGENVRMLGKARLCKTCRRDTAREWAKKNYVKRTGDTK